MPFISKRVVKLRKMAHDGELFFKVRSFFRKIAFPKNGGYKVKRGITPNFHGFLLYL